VSKIEGTFRSCCENAVGVMRSSAAEISGLLQVFVYDPLKSQTGDFGQIGSADLANLSQELNGREDGQKLAWRGWMPWW
jgi:FKBP12-rapamycin complex-associated protein